MPQKLMKLIHKTGEARAALQSWYDTAGVKSQLDDDARREVESVLLRLGSFETITALQKLRG
jgi:hypothetical protein